LGVRKLLRSQLIYYVIWARLENPRGYAVSWLSVLRRKKKAQGVTFDW
jgi:hypothetical protein